MSRKMFAALCGSVGLLAAGLITAVAIAATTGTVAVCATAATPAHTVAVDGAAVATIAGSADLECATTTYTIPTVTETVTTTVAGSTTTSATTTTTTTTTSSSPTYDSEIAYTQTRPSFTPTRTVAVSNGAQLGNAVANLRAGDLVEASAPFTLTHTAATGAALVVKARLSAAAVIDLTGVTIVYSGGSNYAAVWLNNAQNVRIYGGDLSTTDTGGACVTSYGGQSVSWWGFNIHDCGGTGFGFATVTAAATNDDFQGTITKIGQNLAWDPHAEKGSGEHCLNMDDGGQYAFHDNRVAVYCHDIPTGAAIEYGSRAIAPVNNTIILKAVNLTFVSQTQTGGNAIQFWGVNGQSADVKYLEVVNAQGYGVFDGGMYSGTTLAGVTVEYGRASSTNLNPRYAGRSPWQMDKGVVYQNVLP